MDMIVSVLYFISDSPGAVPDWLSVTGLILESFWKALGHI